MENFEIEDKGNHQMLYCRKRNLEIMVGERMDIPQYPDHLLLAFGIIKKRQLANHTMENDIMLTFGIINHQAINYEPYFKHLLITNAINYYVAMEWHVAFDEVSYSPAYQAEFIDSRSLVPAKMTPELQGYMKRGIFRARLDFDEWKAQYWDTK